MAVQCTKEYLKQSLFSFVVGKSYSQNKGKETWKYKGVKNKTKQNKKQQGSSSWEERFSTQLLFWNLKLFKLWSSVGVPGSVVEKILKSHQFWLWSSVVVPGSMVEKILKSHQFWPLCTAHCQFFLVSHSWRVEENWSMRRKDSFNLLDQHCIQLHSLITCKHVNNFLSYGNIFWRCTFSIYYSNISTILDQQCNKTLQNTTWNPEHNFASFQDMQLSSIDIMWCDKAEWVWSM